MKNSIKSIGIAALLCCTVLTSLALAQRKPAGKLVADTTAQLICGGCVKMGLGSCSVGGCGGQSMIYPDYLWGTYCEEGNLIGCDGVTGGQSCDCYTGGNSFACYLEQFCGDP